MNSLKVSIVIASSIGVIALIPACKAGGGLEPIALAKATPNPQIEGGRVTFSDNGSYDPDGGGIVKYEWDLNNDGSFDREGIQVESLWMEPGEFEVQFKVTDNDGNVDTLDQPLILTINEELPPGLVISVTMRLADSIKPNLFYYIVFNLSGDSSSKPYPVFDGEDRGKYWSVYYMYGQPPFRDLGLYRGFGGTLPNGVELIDAEPLERVYLNELLPGTEINDDHITLVINLDPPEFPLINLNMIVCNQAIDATSRIEYEYDPLVWDSFKERGITIDLEGSADYWGEASHPLEDIPNEHEENAPASANIVDWRFQILQR